MKHQDKISKALALRIANAPKERGYKTPGSRNPRKTGYFGGRK